MIICRVFQSKYDSFNLYRDKKVATVTLTAKTKLKAVPPNSENYQCVAKTRLRFEPHSLCFEIDPIINFATPSKRSSSPKQQPHQSPKDHLELPSRWHVVPRDVTVTARIRCVRFQPRREPHFQSRVEWRDCDRCHHEKEIFAVENGGISVSATIIRGSATKIILMGSSAASNCTFKPDIANANSFFLAIPKVPIQPWCT